MKVHVTFKKLVALKCIPGEAVGVAGKYFCQLLGIISEVSYFFQIPEMSGSWDAAIDGERKSVEIP